jgi:multidrug efflux pump subunit AcrB
MWLVLLALRRPITIVVAVLGIALGATLALWRMPRDIFPDLGVPIIYVTQTWPGMTPAQMEGLLVSKYEYHFLYIAGIEHIESQSIQNVSIMKLYFHPGTDTAYAVAQVTAMAYRSTAFMPPGTTPPFIMRLDAGSYPVAQLVFESATRSDVEIQDLALFRARPILQTLNGVSAPPPFGGKVRMVVVTVDPERLRRYGMSPEEVALALAKSNPTLPEGAVRIGDEQLITKTNDVVERAAELNDVPIRTGSGPTVFVSDVGYAADAGDVVTNIAHVNGKRTVYLPITKRAGPQYSTLAVIEAVREKLPMIRATLQAAIPDINVHLEFDQSGYVRNSIRGLFFEGVLGAVLTGLTVLVFLRDLRSSALVVVSIPTSILLALIALWLSGHTINVMTLGGLALAVGILVDEATVEIENIHTHLARGKSVADAVPDAMHEVRAPRFIAMLCVCAVFLPAFFMVGTGRALFGALALAVAFAMISSYLITSTLVPVLSVWFLGEHGKKDEHATEGEVKSKPGRADRARDAYASAVRRLSARGSVRWIVIAVFLAGCAPLIWLGLHVPEELFPTVNPDQFQVRISAPDGTRLEATEQLTLDVLEEVKREAGEDQVETSLANIGSTTPSYPVNAIFGWNSGPQEATLLISLKPDPKRSLTELEESLRAKLGPRFPGVRFSFEAADVISQVLNTGQPNPVNVVVTGSNNLASLRAYAEKIRAELAKLPELRDLSIPLPLDYPTLAIDIDRKRAGQLGVTASDVGRALVEATWSSQLTQIIFWVDPGSGLGYYITIRVPEKELGSLEAVNNLPVMQGRADRPLLRDLATIRRTTTPGEFDRWNNVRMIRIVANAGTHDLAAVSKAVDRAIARAGAPPSKDIEVKILGQTQQMRETLDGLRNGLGIAILVVILLLAATFQSFRDAFAVLLGIPAVLAGVVAVLLATGTSLNIQSFMGTIMAIGVSVANAVLLVKFFLDRRKDGADAVEAAQDAATSRLRPILMTSLAMLAGMIPMALGIGEAGQQNAPLGRAVMGGLAASTVATLFVLPSILALLHGRRPFRSASLDRSDPESPYYTKPEEKGEEKRKEKPEA